MEQHILKQVLAELIDMGKSLHGSIMKLYYFARETKNEELIAFLKNEINGYQIGDVLPDYRKTAGQLFVTLQFGIYGDGTEVREIPRSMVPEDALSLLTEVRLYEGVAVLEKMATEKSQEQFIYKGLPMESLHTIVPAVEKLYKSDSGQVIPISARVRANANVVTQVPQTIRMRLLDFVYEIKEAIGLEINISEFSKHPEKINQITNNFMSTNIHNTGDGNFINTGDNNQNTVNITIQKGDLAAFKQKLADIGVDKQNIEEISEIVQTEKPDGASLGPKASSWLVKMYTNALSGAGKITLGAAGNLLATIVKQVLGLEA
ncbi:MAG TPA: hypothetical protein VM802_24220 [Chitinophaga sp.]|uniref:AbiTii domain-containing protein n=1 Tax=Chitinophaga sp. TaxID=1869181 RepID=UPI002CA61738|nr:hypothetical protein [Chitinophaga sp.]HVI47996.1 hypothetical protein [Chitinophaga sp.]